MITATYSPEDNKLRLYSSTRLDPDTYAQVRAAGFIWAPKQDLFVAPMWTPQRADLAEELAGEIGDEDTALVDRAEERAERFGDYSESRERDAHQAHAAVAAIADNIPLGQPILVGHHSERHARRDAEKIENGMRRAVKMWETSKYWQQRAAGAIRHAKYKERPDVRARRIKGLEADLRKLDKADKESAATLALWALVDKPEKWKQADNSPKTREERAAYVAGKVWCNVSRKNESDTYWTAYDVLRLPAEERYKAAPVMTVDEVIADLRASFARATDYRNRWREHYKNRLAYERAMLNESGGTASDQVKPEVGGACQCLWAPRGGWAYIVKVNRVTVTLRHQWNQGGKVFAHNEPFDKLRAVMSRAQVEEARAQGRIKEHTEGIGFWLMQSREEFDRDNPPSSESNEPKNSEVFDKMKETLRAGVQIITAPQLFPTPRDLAQRMADLAELKPGMRVLEPSAGTGALIGAMGGRIWPGGTLHAVEHNQTLAGRLQAEFPLTMVHCADFLGFAASAFEPFDRIIMNPPFANGADIRHILHARSMLAEDGVLIALCANGPRQQEQLRPISETWEQLPPGTFQEQGTNINVVLLTIKAA